jgi:hypothetical protein
MKAEENIRMGAMHILEKTVTKVDTFQCCYDT